MSKNIISILLISGPSQLLLITQLPCRRRYPVLFVARRAWPPPVAGARVDDQYEDSISARLLSLEHVSDAVP